MKRILEHARLFSLAVHGASLLYNLMIAERYVKAGHTRIENPVGRYRDLLQEWAQECEANDGELSAWDRGAFWDFILAMNPQVRPVTRKFLSTWFDRVCRLEIHQAADDEALRQLVADRESAQKGSQSRLANPRLLAAWSGQSGTRRLTYRWDQANRIIQDLHDGLEAAGATS